MFLKNQVEEIHFYSSFTEVLVMNGVGFCQNAFSAISIDKVM